MADKKFRVDDLESLLSERSRRNYHVLEESNPENNQRLQARKSADLTDFINMIAKLVSKGMKKQKAVFSPDEGDRPKADLTIPLNEPHIYYDVISRVPKKELKPRERQEILEHHIDKEHIRQGRIFGQKFECIVQFNIMSSDYKSADEVMKVFEELIFNYTSYLKENGVAEVLFKQQMTDRGLDPFRQFLSVRSLQYYVEVEKLHAVFDESEIEGIITD